MNIVFLRGIFVGIILPDFIHMGGFLKWWVSPTNPWVFLLKMIILEVFGGYHYLRKHPHRYRKFGPPLQGETSSKEEETFGKVYVNSPKGGWYRVSMSQFEALQFHTIYGQCRKEIETILYKVGRGSSFEWSELWGPFKWRNIING